MPKLTITVSKNPLVNDYTVSAEDAQGSVKKFKEAEMTPVAGKPMRRYVDIEDFEAGETMETVLTI